MDVCRGTAHLSRESPTYGIPGTFAPPRSHTTDSHYLQRWYNTVAMKRLRTSLALVLALLTAAGFLAGGRPCACGPAMSACCCAATGVDAVRQASCCSTGQPEVSHQEKCSCGCSLQAARDDSPAARYAPPTAFGLPAGEPVLFPAPETGHRVAAPDFIPEPFSGLSPPSLRAPPVES